MLVNVLGVEKMILNRVAFLEQASIDKDISVSLLSSILLVFLHDSKDDKSAWNGGYDEEDPYSFIEEDIYEELVPRCQERSPDKRELCLRELIETEKNYSDALKRVLCNFYKPLKETLGEENCSVIFFKFKEMADIHTHLYKGLHDARSNPHNLPVSQVFITSQEKLLIYGDYCANLSKAQVLLEKLMAEDSVIRQKIKDCETLMSNRQYQLRDYLVVPLQRILKYHLLLGELIKHTSENHDEYYGLKKAFEAMVDVADYVNEVKRDKETLQIIQDLQSSITDIPEHLKDLKEFGRLKLDGEIKIECHPDKNKTRFVFIFDKVMIMCKHAKQVD
ncbi:Protein vav [Armadillidium nasatum]|uniref:Protein vav n=1 Tax=Armadillidium nasatum TaxID=96803 RepID=A0A5N5SN68_9CRUS|nr:Protein vav [Armadillidium nasatum]